MTSPQHPHSSAQRSQPRPTSRTLADSPTFLAQSAILAIAFSLKELARVAFLAKDASQFHTAFRGLSDAFEMFSTFPGVQEVCSACRKYHDTEVEVCGLRDKSYCDISRSLAHTILVTLADYLTDPDDPDKPPGYEFNVVRGLGLQFQDFSNLERLAKEEAGKAVRSLEFPGKRETTTAPTPPAGGDGQTTAAEKAGRSVPEAAEIMFLGGGRYQAGDEIIALDGNQASVLQALVELRAATKDDLVRKSGVEDAPRVLRTIRKKHPQLAPAITLPGGKGRGGYRTTVRVKE